MSNVPAVVTPKGFICVTLADHGDRTGMKTYLSVPQICLVGFGRTTPTIVEHLQGGITCSETVDEVMALIAAAQ